MSLQNGVEFILARFRAMNEDDANGGGGMGMLALMKEPDDNIDDLLTGEVVVSAVNSPRQLVLSGRKSDLQNITLQHNSTAQSPRRSFKMLNTKSAFHSSAMSPSAERLSNSARSPLADGLESPSLPMVSTVTGQVEHDVFQSHQYWAEQIVKPVMFAGAVNTLLSKMKHELFLEIGAGRVLSSLVEETAADIGASVKCWQSCPRSNASAVSTFMHMRHVCAAIGGFVPFAGRVPWKMHRFPYFVTLPTVTHNTLSSAQSPTAISQPPQHFVLGSLIAANNVSSMWQVDLSVSPHFDYLQDHVVNGGVVAPGALFISMALASQQQSQQHQHHQQPPAAQDVSVSRLQFESFLPVVFTNTDHTHDNDDGPPTLDVTIARHTDTGRFVVSSGQQQQHFSATVMPVSSGDGDGDGGGGAGECISRITEVCIREVSPVHRYKVLNTMGLAFGPSFRLMKSARVGKNVSVCTIEPSTITTTATSSDDDGSVPHPLIIDCCFQSTVYAMEYELVKPTDVFVPYRCDSLVFKPSLYDRTKSVRCYVERSGGGGGGSGGGGDDDDDTMHFNFWASSCTDGDGNSASSPFLVVREFVVKRFTATMTTTSSSSVPPPFWHTIRWDTIVDEKKQNEDGDDVSMTWSLVGTKRVDDTMKSLKRVMKKHCGETHVQGFIWKNDDPTITKLQATNVIWWICDDDCIESLMEFCQALIVKSSSSSSSSSLPPRVCVVTFGCSTMDGQMYGQGHVLGFVRSFRNENPHVRVQLVDIVSVTDDAPLFRTVLSYDHDEVAIRQGRVFVSRVVPVGDITLSSSFVPVDDTCTDDSACWKLIQRTRGDMSSFALQQQQPPPPLQPHDVEVTMEYWGLNYRDAILASNALGTDAFAGGRVVFGGEGGGRVLRVGAAVTRVAVGDAVYGVCDQGMVSRGVMHERVLHRVPENLQLSDVSGVYISYITAYASLVEMARVKPDQVVLIHSAADAVGSAAVQLAVDGGAIVVGTASTEEKREYVHRQLGAQYTCSSRTSEFVDVVHRVSDGRGADVVLNSLSGDLMTASVRVLAPFGCFVEIGKVDALNNRALNIRDMLNNQRYMFFDLDRYMRYQPAQVSEWSDCVHDMLSDGRLKPPNCRVYSLGEVGDALTYLGRSKHIGKVLVEIPSSLSSTPAPLPLVRAHGTQSSFLSSSKVYVVFGGTSGLGLQIGAWLVTQGAGHVCLVSRSGRVHADNEWMVEEMRARASAADVSIRSCDVTVLNDVKKLFTEFTCDVGGIVFGAASWDDGTVANMTRESLHKAMDPKMLGTYNVHTAVSSSSSSLDFFVVLSSIASVVGAPGLANYNAGNAYQETLMAYRRHRLQVPGAVLNLGGIIDTGHMLDDSSLSFDAEYMLLTGDVLKALQTLIQQQPSVSSLIVHKFSEPEVQLLSQRPQFASVQAIPPRNKSSSGIQLNMSRDELLTVIRDVISVYVVAANYTDDTPFMEMGIDSLSLAAMASTLSQRIGAQVAPALLFAHPTVNKLSQHLMTLSKSGRAVTGRDMVLLQETHQEHNDEDEDETGFARV